MNNSDKVYPQVDDIPDNIKKEWLNNAPQSVTVSITYDEQYQFNKLYETLLDMNIIDDLEPEIERVFDKIREANKI